MDTLANRNNNPGNIKNSSGDFVSFNSPQEGYAALLNDLQVKQSGKSKTGLKPESTLADFSKTYAPSSDKNDPAQYTANLANHMGVRPDSKLSELNVGKWADAIANAEGYKSKSNNSTSKKSFEDVINQPTSPDSSIQEQHGAGLAGIGGELVSGLVKPFAKVATSGLNIAQVATGNKPTTPFSGKFLGQVDPIGKGFEVTEGLTPNNVNALKDSAGTGADIALTLGGGKLASGITKGLLGNTGKQILKNPEIVKILEGSIGKGETIANLSRQEAMNTLSNYLKEMSVKESGGKTEQLILKALRELNPTLIEKKSLLAKLAKGGYETAKLYALSNLLGNKVGGFVNQNTH